MHLAEEGLHAGVDARMHAKAISLTEDGYESSLGDGHIGSIAI